MLRFRRSDIGTLRRDANALDAAGARVAEARVREAEHAPALAALWQRRGGHFVPRARLLERRLPRREGHRVGAHGAARYDGARRAVARALDRAERAVQDARHAALVHAVRRSPVRAHVVRQSARRRHSHSRLRSRRVRSSPSLAAPHAASLSPVSELAGSY